jgi:hypothetical protein
MNHPPDNSCNCWTCAASRDLADANFGRHGQLKPVPDGLAPLAIGEFLAATYDLFQAAQAALALLHSMRQELTTEARQLQIALNRLTPSEERN